MCCGEAGEKEKESTQGILIIPCAFFFPIIAIFIGTPSGSLCGGESYQTCTGDEANCSLYYDNQLFWHVFLVVQLLLGNA